MSAREPGPGGARDEQQSVRDASRRSVATSSGELIEGQGSDRPEDGPEHPTGRKEHSPDAGDRDAAERLARFESLLTELYQTYRAPLIKLARPMGARDLAEAEDILQEAAYRVTRAVCEGKADFQHLSKLKTYLRKAIHDVAIDRWRRAATNVLARERTVQAESSQAPRVDESYRAASLLGPEELLRKKEARQKHQKRWRRVRGEIQRLSPMQRMVVEHRYLGGRADAVPFAEIGARCGFKASTARTHHDRAMATLRRRLSTPAGGGDEIRER